MFDKILFLGESSLGVGDQVLERGVGDLQLGHLLGKLVLFDS